MLTLLMIPRWQAIHPYIVHIPVLLLALAPLFVLIGMIRQPGQSFPFLMTALVLMALGTISTFVAASSGEAAEQGGDQAAAVLEQHLELAQSTEIAFSTLTLIFLAILFVPRLLRREPSRMISTVLPSIFLVFYATGAISLANTVQGGYRITHQRGAEASIHASASPAGDAKRTILVGDAKRTILAKHK